MPRAEDIVHVVGQHNVFWKLDLKSGFWQVPMHPNSMPITGFCTLDGLYQWHRMPMDLRNGLPQFQHCMNNVLLEYGMQTHAGVFIDDLGSGGADHKAAANSLNSIMQALED